MKTPTWSAFFSYEKARFFDNFCSFHMTSYVSGVNTLPSPSSQGGLLFPLSHLRLSLTSYLPVSFILLSLQCFDIDVCVHCLLLAAFCHFRSKQGWYQCLSNRIALSHLHVFHIFLYLGTSLESIIFVRFPPSFAFFHQPCHVSTYTVFCLIL